MTASLLRLAIGAVRLWTRLYTWRLPRAIRDARRAEIESDLWESRADTSRRDDPIVTLARLALGLPDDLRWRREHAVAPARALVAGAAGAAVGLLLLWAALVMTRATTPPAPPAPTFRTKPVHYPTPPPPPPPPCNPPGVGRPRTMPCS